MLNTQENAQQLSLNREKTLLLPTISGFYNYTGVTNTSAFTPPQHMVGVSAKWNIFQSGMRSAKISQAKIALAQTQNVKEQESERLIFVAQQAKFDYQTALNKYYNEEINFELSKKVFDKTTLRHKEGLVSSLDLSIVNNQYLGAQLSYAMAIQQLLVSKIALDKAYNQL
jgi:outer membrane protein TolC